MARKPSSSSKPMAPEPGPEMPQNLPVYRWSLTQPLSTGRNGAHSARSSPKSVTPRQQQEPPAYSKQSWLFTTRSYRQPSRWIDRTRISTCRTQPSISTPKRDPGSAPLTTHVGLASALLASVGPTSTWPSRSGLTPSNKHRGCAPYPANSSLLAPTAEKCWHKKPGSWHNEQLLVICCSELPGKAPTATKPAPPPDSPSSPIPAKS